MKKILISWWAPMSDFYQPNDKKRGVNELGPNVEVHQYFYENYEKHILLCSEKPENTRFEFLCNYLRLHFPTHTLDARCLALNDVSDFFEIKSKVEPILWEHRDFEIHLFFAPGTSAMSVVWFLLHQQLGLDTVLLQTIKSSDTKDAKPARKFLRLEKSDELSSFLIKQSNEEKKLSLPKNKNYLLTDSLKPIYQLAATVAQADRGNILILGASGTGKEHLARYIHEQSVRSKAAFLTVNCAAFGDTLLESRLFGHKKGSFTGAFEDHKGYFEEAHRGTIFLDEIGDISPYMQQLLLRVLQNQEIAPIGGKPKKVDVRILAATNRDLVKHCQDGLFRWDLYYRLAMMELELPSLQARGAKEVEALAKFFIEQKQKLFGRNKPIVLSPAAWSWLLSYTFPGNVRELENLIERFYLLNRNPIEEKDFPERMQKMEQVQSLRLEDVESAHIKKVLAMQEGNLAKTAKVLDISLNTLKRKLKK